MMLARRGGVRLPRVAAMTALPDESVVLAMERVDGRRARRGGRVGGDRRAAGCGLAGGAAAARRGLGPSLPAGREHPRGRRRSGRDRPRVRRDGGDRPHAGDRPGRAPRVHRRPHRRRALGGGGGPDDPGPRPRRDGALPPAPRALGGHPEGRVEVEAGRAPERPSARPPARRPSRSSGWCGSGPKTLLTIAMLVGAFYVLLPQLASVDDSFEAIGDANYGWLAVSFVMSILTYVGLGDRSGGRGHRAAALRRHRRDPAGVVVRQPRQPGERRWHGPQRALPPEGGRRSRRGRHRRGSQLARRRHRPRGADGGLPRLGRPRRRDRVLHPVEQQGAGGPGGRARAPRDRAGDPEGAGG